MIDREYLVGMNAVFHYTELASGESSLTTNGKPRDSMLKISYRYSVSM